MKQLKKTPRWAAVVVSFISLYIAGWVLFYAGDLPLYAPLIGAISWVFGLGALFLAAFNKPAS